MEGRDYASETEKLKGFIQDFQDEDIDGSMYNKYMRLLQQVANRRERKVHVDLDDVFESLGDDIGDAMRTNTKRYQRLLADAIDQVMPDPTTADFPEDVADILTRSRQQQAADGTDADAKDSQQVVPKSLTRRYEVLIMPRVKEKAVPLRQVKAGSIGNLLTVKGIVTRVSEVKPSIAVATYTCAKGGFEVYQEVQSRSFMPLFSCPATNCCGATGRLNLQTRGCKFLKFQEVKIQEEADEVPVGHVPRQLTVGTPPLLSSPLASSPLLSPPLASSRLLASHLTSHSHSPRDDMPPGSSSIPRLVTGNLPASPVAVWRRCTSMGSLRARARRETS